MSTLCIIYTIQVEGANVLEDDRCKRRSMFPWILFYGYDTVSYTMPSLQIVIVGGQTINITTTVLIKTTGILCLYTTPLVQLVTTPY